MKPHLHSKASVHKYGGIEKDYQEIHDFIDSSKCAHPDIRHRALLHSSFGIYIVEKVFGIVIINSSNKEVSVRDIAEDHIIQDLGFIPSVEKYLNNMTIQPWMSGTFKSKHFRPTSIKLELEYPD